MYILESRSSAIMQLILHAIHCNSYEGLKLSRLRRIVYPEAILGYKIEVMYSGGCDYMVLPSLDSKHDWRLLCHTVVIVSHSGLLCHTVVIVSHSGYSKCLMHDDVVMEVNNQVNCIVMAYFCL